ncbi:response regulator transcription factor [Candidatus Dojkabacteria bacterium]|nr:response regulator transcription factor [Candidatus Dojkabacteria bacterium]
MRLLIIEDESAISIPLKKGLEKRNFAVDVAEDGKIGYEMASVNNYDCLILDLNLPEMDGIEVASTLRQDKIETPILMLTARARQKDILEGFISGTDDYLVKPFDFQELVFRINALIKRNSKILDNILTAKDIVMDTLSLKVNKNNKEVILNAKEYGILEYLMRNKGKMVSQEELIEHVWNESLDLFSQTVRTNIKTLRKKIDPKKEIIKTFKGKGYIIE